jgi:glycine/D-amino acid oxidase-like deaminating enzyme
MKIDFLIIGQGLAGSLLAWELIKRGCKVVVSDSGKENASIVAAGIINPISGQRFVKTLEIDTLLPAAEDYYSQLSVFFGQQFYIKKPLFRLFQNENEVKLCQKRQHQEDYTPYLSRIIQPNQQSNSLISSFGFIEQLQCGHLLTVPLISALKQFFIQQNAYRQIQVDYSAIEVDSNIRWQQLTANCIIFCEGHNVYANPWFSWLPLRRVKGEILTLLHKLELQNCLFNYGNWLLPIEMNKVRIGATFDRVNINSQPSEQGKVSLLNKLRLYSPELAQSTVVSHQAGIRPCSADRQPFVGRHPYNHNVAIFNGFGAKGSLQIPWYSQRFADYLLNQQPLPISCDNQRYKATYFFS